MADITVNCPACNHACKVSEYVSAESIPCPSCGMPVPIPTTAPPSEASIQSTLRLKKTFEKGLVEKKEEPTVRKKEIKRSSSMEKVHQTKEKARGPNPAWGVLMLLVCGGGMFYLLYSMGQHPEYMQYYKWMRNGIGAIALGLLYLTAFQESHVQGFLTLLVPPYGLYYVYVRADSYAVRAMFTALLIAVAAEYKYMRDDSLITHANDGWQNFIQGGEDLIDAANKDVEKF